MRMVDTANGSKAQNTTLAQRLVAQHWEETGGVLSVEGHLLPELMERFGSPLYVYSAKTLRRRLLALCASLGERFDVFFSVKANPNPKILSIFLQEGAGLEIASVAEYIRALRAGAPKHRILYAGPGKIDDELAYVVKHGIGEIHVESFAEIERLARITRQHVKTVSISIRVNPAASVQGGAMRMGGGPTAFGIDEVRLEPAIDRISECPSLILKGLHLYSGTQILKAETLLAQWKHGISIARQLIERGVPLSTLDLGGGLGIPYFETDKALDLDLIANDVRKLVQEIERNPLLKSLNLMVEPGRFLAGPAGLYATRVTTVKSSYDELFTITDGGMHHHLAATGNLGQIIKKDYPVLIANRLNEKCDTPQKVVGPLCTPLDTYGRKTVLPRPQIGDTVAVLQSGAYGLSSSPVGFLSHPMPAEILVDGPQVLCIRQRGSYEQPITPLP